MAFSRWLVDDRQHSWMDIGGQLTLDSLVPVMKDNPGHVCPAERPPRAHLKDEYLRSPAQCRTSISIRSTPAPACPRSSGYDILRMVKEFGADRFLFGSAYPFRDPISALIRLEVVNELDAGGKGSHLVRERPTINKPPLRLR